MTSRPRSRRVTPVQPASVSGYKTTLDDMPLPELTLADLTRGQTALVEDVYSEVDPAAARRMSDLGFVPGARVEMLRKAPMADPVIFRIAGYDIAMRRVQARCIRVSITQ